MTWFFFTQHALDRLTFFSNFPALSDLTEERIKAIIHDKMKHIKVGEHWIVLRVLPENIVLRRGGTHVNGNTLVAVVDDGEINTIMLRRDKQTPNCNYYWE